MKAHVAVYELRIVRSLASLLDAKALMSNRKRDLKHRRRHQQRRLQKAMIWFVEW